MYDFMLVKCQLNLESIKWRSLLSFMKVQLLLVCKNSNQDSNQPIGGQLFFQVFVVSQVQGE